MNEQKENVKVLTKEDVIKLSNFTKRLEFLKNYESWGVWLDIPELNVQVFKAELPMEQVIFVTRFKNNVPSSENYSTVYRYGNSCNEYNAYGDGCTVIADKLKEFKKMFLEEKKNESSNVTNKV